MFQRSGSRRRRGLCCEMRWLLLIRPTIVFCYFLIGCAFYVNAEPRWSFLDAVYFQIVTVSTVGYGDLHPSTDGSRLFTVFWMVVGVIVIFANIHHAVLAVSRPIIDGLKRLLVRLCAKERGIDLDGDGIDDLVVPGAAVFYYPKELAPSFALALTVQLCFACVLLEMEHGVCAQCGESVLDGHPCEVVEEPHESCQDDQCECVHWTFALSLYHCMTTAMTVGYGDVRILTQAGKAVACFHILISVAIIGLVISEINQAAVKRRKSMEQLRLIQCRLNVELLLSLDKDNNGVDKLEFVIGMIVKLGLLSWSDVEPFMKQFDLLDTDGSGRLDRDDLVRCVSLTMDEIGRERAETLKAAAASGGGGLARSFTGVTSQLLSSHSAASAMTSLLHGSRKASSQKASVDSESAGAPAAKDTAAAGQRERRVTFDLHSEQQAASKKARKSNSKRASAFAEVTPGGWLSAALDETREV